MDRLETSKLPLRLLDNIYLHSSMDRLETLVLKLRIRMEIVDLHSSMDRLETSILHS